MKTLFYVQSSASLFRGVLAPEAIPPAAARLGYKAVVLADRNTLAGAPAFFRSARRYGINPILGLELVDRKGQGALLLACNRSGYEQMCLLLSERNLRTDWSLTEELRNAGEGLFVAVGRRETALALAPHLGPDRLGLIVLRPGRSVTEERTCLELACRLHLRCLAASRCAYLEPMDREVGRLLRAIAKGDLLSRTEPPPGVSFIPHADRWENRFGDLPDTVRASEKVLERCNLVWGENRLIVPRPPFALPEEPDRFLRRLVKRGLRRRFGRLTPEVRKRTEYELAEIRHLGLAGYFLVVWDIVRRAEAAGILCTGRGSGAGSLVCYALGITAIDPVSSGLLFERFLNRLRPDLPDLDLDVDWRRRDEVIEAIYRRYGPEQVAMIAMYVTYRERLAFREAARAWGLPPGEVDRLSAKIPYSPQVRGLAEALRRSPRARGIPWSEPPLSKIVALAERLITLPRHLSVHPAGVVIGDRPLSHIVPLTYAPKGVIVTQFDMYDVEETGLIKLDILGNRALGEIASCSEILARQRATAIDPASFPLDDPKTGAMVREGRTVGCFQIESPAMRHLLVALGTERWEQLCIAVAAIRPGPSAAGAKDELIARRHGGGGTESKALGAVLKQALSRTGGVFLFDEDIMRVFHAVTGRPFAEGELLRIELKEARGDPKRLAPLRERFLAAAGAAGTPSGIAREVFNAFVRFAGYTYNHAHAAVFSRIAWWLAYLKAHFPTEFFCAVLNNHGGMYPMTILLAEAVREGIEIRGPCVNRSEDHFTVEGSAIRMPLTVVRNLSQRTMERIRRERPFRSVTDFIQRVRPWKREVENLINAGAFDFTGRDRLHLVWEYAVSSMPAKKEPAVREFFPRPQTAPPLPPLTRRAQAARELAVLPFSPTAHPMALLREELPSGVLRARELSGHVGRQVEVAGLLAAFREVPGAGGAPMAFVSLQDETGWAEAVFFPPAYRKVAPALGGMGPYILGGIVRRRYGVLHIEGMSLRRLQRKQHSAAPL